MKKESRRFSGRKCTILLTAGFMLGSSGCERPRLAAAKSPVDPSFLVPEAQVSDVLIRLGATIPVQAPGQNGHEWIAAGKEIVHLGKSDHPETGVPGERISAYFYCADCHNSGREEADLATISDPLAKAKFAVERDLSLLPGSTFAGMVNRTSWYNGDYAKKYRFSPSVRAARTDLRKAIELCSRECSQGRNPEPWEMEAMMAYFWSLGWTLDDLGFTNADLAETKRRALNPEEHETLAAEIRSRFAAAAPATFGDLPADPVAGYAIERDPDPEAGGVVWEHSCLHCHGAEGASEHYFGDKLDTWTELARKFRAPSGKSLYGLIRIGTEPKEGKRPYMPNFTQEKLSDGQIEDLRAFIEKKAATPTGTE